MRLLIVALLATAFALVPVASAQTAGPTVRRPSAAGGQVKAAPVKAKSAHRVSKDVDCRGKAAPARAVTKAPPRAAATKA